MSRYDRLIRDLATTEVGTRAVNQYATEGGEAAANAIRRRNLRLYLTELEGRAPSTLLVGEAVSYRGGRLTGIAFVSETVMLGGVETTGGPILGASSGYRKATAGPRLSTEASATMVWETIRALQPLPLLWNAFPFHPFAEGNADSNRAPTPAELLIGERFIARLMRLFAIRDVVAIGNHASLSLGRMGIGHLKVRHPSNGGKQQFVAGMAQLSHLKRG